MPIFGAKSRAARGCASKLARGRRIDPAIRNYKIAHAIGKNVKRFVGADASVRPWAITNLPQRVVKNAIFPDTP